MTSPMQFFLFFTLAILLCPIEGGITTNKTHVMNLATIASWANATNNPILNIAQFATWLINNDFFEDLLPDVEINLVVGNCGSGSGNPANCLVLGTNYVQQNQITGFLTGAYTSDQRVLQFVASAFNLPHVCGVASGNGLSNKNEYPTLVRTATPDSISNYAMVDFILRNGWTHAAVPIENLDFGTGNRDALTRYASARGVDLFFVNCPTGDTDFTYQATLIKNAGYKIILNILQNRESWLFLYHANQLGMVGPDYVWIYSVSGVLATSISSMATAQSIAQLRPLYNGAFGFMPHGGDGPIFEEIFPIWNRETTRFPAPRPAPNYYWFMFDAVMAYAKAVTQIMDRGIPFSEANGTRLLHELWELNFTGSTGINIFDENRDRVAPVDINMFTDSDYEIALIFDTTTGEYEERKPITFYGSSSILL